MTDISGIFSISSSTNPQWISLCGHLEAVIGNYLLSQAGNPEAYWYRSVRGEKSIGTVLLSGRNGENVGVVRISFFPIGSREGGDLNGKNIQT